MFSFPTGGVQRLSSWKEMWDIYLDTALLRRALSRYRRALFPKKGRI